VRSVGCSPAALASTALSDRNLGPFHRVHSASTWFRWRVHGQVGDRAI